MGHAQPRMGTGGTVSASNARVRGLLGVVLVLGARDPWALGLGALLLWPGSRRSQAGLLSALASAALPGLLWGAQAAALCFLTGACAVLAAGHLDFALPARWKDLAQEARHLRARFRAAGWNGRASLLAELIPTVRQRPVKALPELAGWAVLGTVLALMVHASDAPSFSGEPGSGFGGRSYIAETVEGRVRIDRPGRYELAGPQGGITVVHDGMTPRVIASGCATHRCEHQSVRMGGIVCAPNRIVIRRAVGSAGGAAPGEGVHAWTG